MTIKKGFFYVLTFLFSAVGLFSCVTAKTTEDHYADIPYAALSAFVSLGDSDKAIAAYEKAVKNDKQSLEARKLYTSLLLMAGRADEASVLLEKLLEEYPSDPDLLYNLALAEGMKGNLAKQNEILLRMEKENLADERVYSLLGENALMDGKIDPAAVYFTKALKDNPDSVVANSGMANISLRKADFKNAMTFLDAALKQLPSDPFLLSDRGRAKAGLEDYKGAATDLSKSIELLPDYHWNYLDRGKIYLRDKKLDLAFDDFDKAVKLSPQYFLGYVYRAGIYDAKKEYDLALADYLKAVELKPDYYFPYSSIGKIQFMKKEWTQAATAFGKASGFEKDRLELLLLQYAALRLSGKKDDSVKKFRSLGDSIGPDNPFYIVCQVFGGNQSDSKLIDAIKKQKEKVLKAQLLFYLGLYNEAIGMPTAATAYYAQSAGQTGSPYMETEIADAFVKKVP
jgi:tetratricopeptide (TPR) repeat protein